jgi:hypothetical protein
LFVAIVVAGLTFAFGDGGSKRIRAGASRRNATVSAGIADSQLAVGLFEKIKSGHALLRLYLANIASGQEIVDVRVGVDQTMGDA